MKTTMYKSGKSWIVVSWDASMQMSRESTPMNYYMARMHCDADNCRRKNCTIPSHMHKEAADQEAAFTEMRRQEATYHKLREWGRVNDVF